MRTYTKLIGRISNIENQLEKYKIELNNHFGTKYIEAVLKNSNWFKYSDAELLVMELLKRDEKLYYDDIKDIFKFSGFDYNNKHILDSKPDKQLTGK